MPVDVEVVGVHGGVAKHHADKMFRNIGVVGITDISAPATL